MTNRPRLAATPAAAMMLLATGGQAQQKPLVAATSGGTFENVPLVADAQWTAQHVAALNTRFQTFLSK